MPITRNHLERYLIASLLQSQSSTLTTTPDGSIFTRPEDQLALEEKIAITTLKPVADEIKRIAEGYTNLRDNTIAALSAPASRAYALYYTLINFEKIERLLKISPIPSRKIPLRVLDYGCGPGTAAFALASISNAPLALTIADNNPAMLSLATSLLKPLRDLNHISSLTAVSPLDINKEEPFDLIIAAHVFNEFPISAQRQLADRLLPLLASDGTFFIIESALQEQTRQLMQLRDYILDSDQSMQVAFPCTHRQRCPMLARDSEDWCHGTLAWKPPHLIRQLDQLTGFNKHRIKYSAFVLSRTVRPAAPGNEFRVVAPPEQSKRGNLLRLCGESFYGDCLLSKRSRSERSIEFRRAEQFDLVRIDSPAPVTKDLDPDAIVTRLRAP